MSNLGLFRWKSMVPNKTKECHISTILTIFQYLEPDAAWWIEEFWWYWFGIIILSLARCNLWSFDFFHHILSYPFKTHLPKIQGPTHATSENTPSICLWPPATKDVTRLAHHWAPWCRSWNLSWRLSSPTSTVPFRLFPSVLEGKNWKKKKKSGKQICNS